MVSRSNESYPNQYPFHMSWPWAIGCFVVWIGLGSLVWRNLGEIRLRLAGMSRGVRIFQGTTLLFATAAILIGGFVLLSSRTDPKASLGVVEWIGVAALGSLFVMGQSLAAAILFSLVDPGVTNSRPSASIIQNLEGKDS